MSVQTSALTEKKVYTVFEGQLTRTFFKMIYHLFCFVLAKPDNCPVRYKNSIKTKYFLSIII